MQISFSSPAIKHCYSLRCLPVKSEVQQILSEDITINPKNHLTETSDSFGNRIMTDRIAEPHTDFSVTAEGTARIDFGKIRPEELNLIYKYPSSRTRPGKSIKLLSSSLGDIKNLPAFEAADRVSQKISEIFTYKGGVTGITTTAEEALGIGCGVCQDYSHILISLCRENGIPARYVAGIQKGTGETHAWVEIYDENGCWRGIDPTNKRICDETYLVLSRGRDFDDCGINRGLFLGGGSQNQKITATVEEI